MKKMFTKILVVNLMVIGFLTASILLLSFNTIKKHYIETLLNDLKNLNYSFSIYISPLLEDGKIDKLNSEVKRFSRNTNVRITIIDTSGVVLADSEKDPATMENHATRTEIEQALLNGFGSSLRYSSTVEEEMLYVAATISKSGRILAVSRISLFIRNIDALYGELRLRIIEIAFFVISISVIIILIFSRNLTRPIKELTQAAKLVSEGNFEAKVFTKSKGELRILADSFNEMTEKVDYLFEKLHQKNEQLDGIISSMQEGLVLIGPDDSIVLSNKRFDKIINSDVSIGKKYWEVLKDNNVRKLINSIRKGKKSRANVIHVFDSYYLCNSDYLEGKDQIVLVLHNISEKKKLELLKKDFIVNVSHELRTPLTSIKGFVETIENGRQDDKDFKHYLEIIKRNTDRLIYIVEDLLTISEFEQTHTEPDLSDVNLKELIENSIKIFEQKIKKKKLELRLNVGYQVGTIRADAFKLEQMFINLISNSINHTKKGSIAINATVENKKIKIEVSDTGRGIPKEHHERIFDRFYTVDKSHSRKMGGTGLGLSIVKHVVKLHKGEISIESEHGKGTKFIIILPQ